MNGSRQQQRSDVDSAAFIASTRTNYYVRDGDDRHGAQKSTRDRLYVSVIDRATSLLAIVRPRGSSEHGQVSVVPTSGKAVDRRWQTSSPVHSSAAPPGESWRIICYIADCKPVSVLGPLCENMTSSTKPEIHNIRPALPM